MRALLAAMVIALSSAWPGNAVAVLPEEILKDPVLERRAREISKTLRCLVCQNQSIDDSNAPLAKDLRVLVRERLTAGDTNEGVMRFVVARYGDFVLLRPPMKPSTYVLWFAPFVVLVLAGIGGVVFLRRRATAGSGAARLSADENRRIKTLLQDDKAP